MIIMAPENLKIIGTAHVSKESIDEVKEAIIINQLEFVSVELDMNDALFHCIIRNWILTVTRI